MIWSNGATSPAGLNTSVWLSGRDQRPLRVGVIFGSPEPRTSATGREKVSRSDVSGRIRDPGPGRASTAGSSVSGNQVTATGGPSRSHARAAAATSTVPAVARGSDADAPEG